MPLRKVKSRAASRSRCGSDEGPRRLPVFHPDRRTPGKLAVTLLHAHVIVTLPRLDRVVEIIESHFVLPRFELVNVLIVLDHVDLGDGGGTYDLDGELRRRAGFDDIAHQRRSN